MLGEVPVPAEGPGPTMRGITSITSRAVLSADERHVATRRSWSPAGAESIASAADARRASVLAS